MSDFSSDINQDYIPQTDQERVEQQHNQKYLKWKSEEDAKAAASTESEAPVEEAAPTEDKGAVYNIGHAAAAIPLGTADFITDTAGLVPWLKPVDEWWDENSPRSNHPAHKVIRDASSVIVPTLATGGVVTGSLKAATAARSIPQVTRILGTIAAHAGVDAGVTAISSHSKDQDNIAAALNDWLGWDLPWATRDTDSPDIIRKKNVMEAAGLSAGVDLLLASFALGKALKFIPADEAAEKTLAKHATGFEGQDPISESVLSRRAARAKEVKRETASRILKDPQNTKYDSFVNDPPIGPNARVVTDLQPNPVKSKIDNYRIQNNIGTTNGRARPVVDTVFLKKLAKAPAQERASQLRELFEQDLTASVGAKINGQVIPPAEINKAVTRLYDDVFKPEVSIKQVETIVNEMKGNIYNAAKVDYRHGPVLAEAFSKAFSDIYNPKTMRASAMVTNQVAGDAADTASAVSLIGDIADTGRQQEIMIEKLRLLNKEVNANKYVVSKAQEFKQIAKAGDQSAINQWLLNQADEFAEGLEAAQWKGHRTYDTLDKIAKANPEYLKPIVLAIEATNGEVDQIHKLNRWTENNIGLVKKAFYDAEPEVPSLVVQGLNGVRYNHMLSGLAPLRAITGNSMLTALKPATVLVGSKLTGDAKSFQKALWTYGGFSENIKRAFKVMGEEWKLAKLKPEEAMMRGRADLRSAKMDNFEALEAMSDVWRAEGENGKVALWNFAKGMHWYNNNPFTKWGINAMYSIDGFTNSMMASGSARAKAYAQLMEETNGAFSKEAFNKLQRRLYDDAFDHTGLLRDKAAKHSAQEIALNLDNDLVNRVNQVIEKVPAAKALFMFPRTGINSLQVAWSFTPGSSLLPAYTKARKVLTANTVETMTEALAEHGLDYSIDAFNSLKSEYIGRQLMGGSVVTAAGLWALEGNLTGNGPHSAGERKRMQDMGAKFNSIKNPITGEWHSYKGFEPFDSLLSTVGDLVYYSDRIDQAATEQMYQKLAFSISMNVANKTFLSGFEPLVSMFSGDEGAFKRFVAGQADSLIPFAPSGMRSILNNAISPQLKDVQNDWGSLMANKWKFMNPANLVDQVDMYTGKPIRFHEPLTAATNAFMPFFKSNGDMEPWRQWLLSTGWDSLPSMKSNPITKMRITPTDRQWVNNWIANNMNLAGQIEGMMTAPDDFWNKKLKEYKKARGWKKQSDYAIKELVVHQELDRIHRDAMRFACSALERFHEQYSSIGERNLQVKNALRMGNIPNSLDSLEGRKELEQLLKY
tara:strand:- start:1227 stop:5030 length:3804 start_codon:yes stop_codon:yes gene_type:complete